jgi:hypothetical protein
MLPQVFADFNVQIQVYQISMMILVPLVFAQPIKNGLGLYVIHAI